MSGDAKKVKSSNHCCGQKPGVSIKKYVIKIIPLAGGQALIGLTVKVELANSLPLSLNMVSKRIIHAVKDGLLVQR